VRRVRVLAVVFTATSAALAITVPTAQASARVMAAVASQQAPTPADAHPVAPVTRDLPVAADSTATAQARQAHAVGTPAPLLVGVATPTEAFSVLGATWQGPLGGATVQVRTQHDGTWSEWTALEPDDTGAEPGSADAASAATTHASAPVFAGPSDAVQTRVVGTGTTPRDLHVVLVDPGTSAADAETATRQPNAVTVGAPAINSRASWGADESLRSRNPGCATPRYTGRIKIGFVHHTDSPNNYSQADVPGIIRGIYAFHVIARSYCDIAYNFLVDKYGGIWEGRAGGTSNPVLGAHSGGFNTDSFGAAIIGTYTSVSPSNASLVALQQLWAWKLGVSYRSPSAPGVLNALPFDGVRYAAGTPVAFNTVSGHRDADLTTCPGNAGQATLPTIRAGIPPQLRVGLISPFAYTTSTTLVSSGLITTQNWTLTITSVATNAVVRTYSGTGTAIGLRWDHRDSDGNPVPDGQYRLTLASNAGPTSVAIPWSTTVALPAVNSSAPAPVTLSAGDALYSPGGQYRLVVQTDGNVVVYGNGRALWNTGTFGHPGATLAMQADGNLVVRDAGRALWNSGTPQAGDTARLTLSADGSLQVVTDYGTQWTNGAPGTDSITAGTTLAAGQYLQSSNDQYKVAMQTDGNVVVYGNGRALWSTGTAGHPGAVLELGTNGTLTVMAGSTALWSSPGTGPNAVLRLTADGDLRVTSGATILWRNGAPGSNTLTANGALAAGQYLRSPSGRYQLLMQAEGNLVLYDSRALWATPTRGAAPQLILQGDGNLVLYNGDGGVLWNTGTAGTGAQNKLVVQEDGNVVLYTPLGPIWSTGTFR
jgi:hypothetical protein